jgi:hypothetical protein
MTGERRRSSGARINATAAPSPPRRVEPVSVPANGFPPSLLVLSDRQIETIMSAAHPLSPVKRGQFLDALAGRLAGEREPGDGTVGRACRELVPLYFEPPDTVAVGRWSRDRAVKADGAQRRWASALPKD